MRSFYTFRRVGLGLYFRKEFLSDPWLSRGLNKYAYNVLLEKFISNKRKLLFFFKKSSNSIFHDF